MKISIIVFLITFAISSLSTNLLNAEIIKNIQIEGNDRISNETIKLFSNKSINDYLKENDLNIILKDLYDTSFFEDISVSFENNILKIQVKENPIIDKITYKGIKSNRIIKILKENALIKSRSSYDETIIKKEKLRIKNTLKNNGYYDTKINIYVEDQKQNLVKVTIDINLGQKAKIKKISFIGDKIFKDSKLRRIIISSEYKFWKFLSGRKFLNENVIEFDKKLLKNFYKNNGYYNAEINTAFAKLVNNNEFELIYNISAKSKVYFGDLRLDLPTDFDKNNFKRINKLFKKIEGEPYSFDKIDDILEEIDLVTELEQYQFINATVDETLSDQFINITFKINETEKFYVNKINIYGNTVTSENVIRNQFELDEGDPYNEILSNKTINNLKSLNFLKA